MLTSICLSDKIGRDYTGQLIHENHELNGIIGNNNSNNNNSNNNNSGGNSIINPNKPPTDKYYDGIGVVDRIGDNPTIPPIIVPPVVILYRGSATGNFTKNDCDAGFQGTTSQFTVNSTSSISQIDADNKATSLLAQQGQTYVNNIGQCLCNLKWEYPTVKYKDDKAYITTVIIGATEYAINNGAYQSENNFTITSDGEYTLQARNPKCIVEGTFSIKLGTDYDITDINFGNIECGLSFPEDGNIEEIEIKDRGCGIAPSDAIDDIIIVQSGCSVVEIADINQIIIKNSC